MKLADIIKSRDVYEGFLENRIHEYPENFDINQFKELSSYRKKLQYAKEQLGKPIGSGSSRSVYRVDETKVLKLAKNKKGIAQNRVEIEWGRDRYFGDLLANVFEYDEENSFWVEMELAVKAKKSDFKNLWGVDFTNMGLYLKNWHSINNGGREAFRVEDEESFIESTEVQKTVEFMHSTDAPAGDFGRISSWGVVERNGENDLVLIDFGLTGEVYNSYYK